MSIAAGLIRVPYDLSELDQWVVWKFETKPNGDNTKVPHQISGKLASSADPSTWTTFETACEHWARYLKSVAGVGFVFSATDPYCGIDLDNCLYDGGKLKPWPARHMGSLKPAASGQNVQEQTTATPDGGTTTRGAADALTCSDRHIRRLIRSKELQTTGTGAKRRITWASIEAYQAQKNTDIYPDMSLRCPPEFDCNKEAMEKLKKTIPPLSAPRSAARRLGIPRAQLEGLVHAGHVPAIRIGPEWFVPGAWLLDVLVRACSPVRKGNA